MLKGIVSDILDHLFDNKCYEEIRADVIVCSQSVMKRTPLCKRPSLLSIINEKQINITMGDIHLPDKECAACFTVTVTHTHCPAAAHTLSRRPLICS